MTDELEEHRPVHGCRECGGIVLADTETWSRPLCFECWRCYGEPRLEPVWGWVKDLYDFKRAPAPEGRPPAVPMSQTVAWAEAPCPKCKARMGDHLVRPDGTAPECPGLPEHLA